jgi:hypothetical protein
MKLRGGDELADDLLESVLGCQELKLIFEARDVGLPFEYAAIQSCQNTFRREWAPSSKSRQTGSTVPCTQTQAVKSYPHGG